MSKKNIETLCAYIENNKAKVYKIENNMLSDATDFIVNGYLKMLAVILQQPKEIIEPQLLLYRRIVAGAKNGYIAEDYLRMSLSVEIEDFINFASEMKDLDVKYRFIFDAMILSCISGKQDEQLRLVAEFSEALKIEKTELEYLAAVAKSVLREDAIDYLDIMESEPESIPGQTFFGYIRFLSKSYVMKNENTTVFQPTCEEDIDISKLNEISASNTPEVRLSQVKLNLSEFPLEFKDRKKVIIDSCEFVGGERYPIKFNNCEEIIIRNSSFTEFKTRTFEIKAASQVRILNTRFEKCQFEYERSTDDWQCLGGVIYFVEVLGSDTVGAPIILDKCTFNICGGINRSNYYSSEFICNHQAEVSDTSFNDCWHYHRKIDIDPGVPRSTMFAKGSKSIRCTFTNSANFCEKQ